MIRDGSYGTNRDDEVDLNSFMNNVVKPKLNIPSSVIWGSQRNSVFDTLRTDFMKPVTEGS